RLAWPEWQRVGCGAESEACSAGSNGDRTSLYRARHPELASSPKRRACACSRTGSRFPFPAEGKVFSLDIPVYKTCHQRTSLIGTLKLPHLANILPGLASVLVTQDRQHSQDLLMDR